MVNLHFTREGYPTVPVPTLQTSQIALPTMQVIPDGSLLSIDAGSAELVTPINAATSFSLSGRGARETYVLAENIEIGQSSET